MEERLQKFARLAEIGSFTRTAKDLHISQPALSIAIDKLEHELGVKLLIRNNRKLELTEAGQATYQAALEHQGATDRLQAKLNRIAKRRPAITIGMIDSVAAVLCNSEAFDTLERAADVTIIVNNSRFLREAAEHRQLDIAFVVDDTDEHTGLATYPIGTEELVLVCHPDLVKETEDSLTNGRLPNLICYDKPSTTYRHIIQTFYTHGIKPHVSLFSTSPDVMLGIVRRAKGVSMLPRFMVEESLAAGALTQVTYNGNEFVINRPICLVQASGKILPECLETFIDSVALS